MEERERVVVLDVGPGVQSTVEFFAGFNGRIHVVDLYSCDLFTDPPEELDAESAAVQLTEYLQLPADVVFDICLFWDLLHRADLPLLRGLSLALAPHMNEHTLGYGFATLHRQSLEPSRYGIRASDQLEIRPLDTARRFFPHTQQQISEHFTDLSIQRATLLKAGYLELLLAYDR